MKIIAATHNKGKIKEIQAVLGKLGFSVISQSEAGISVEPDESGATFEENALIKAREVSKLCDCAVIADDSGLCVDALGGAPGVHSARYAGEGASDKELIEKLLREMDGLENRDAKFVSAIAFIMPDGEEIVTFGEVLGEITLSPSGEDGFGYDPIFYSNELEKTFGQASMQEKNNVSHRARGLMNLFYELEKRF